MKKVLILCDLFPPAFGPRMGYLCKYLRVFGWEPTVLTETVEDEHAFHFLTNLCRVEQVNFYTARKEKARRRQWFFTMLRDFLSGYKDRKMYKAALRICREESFDLVLCSSFNTFPLAAARKIANRLKVPLVVDLRDIVEQYAGEEFLSDMAPKGGIGRMCTPLFLKKRLRVRNRVLKKAQGVTTISPWHVQMLKRYNPNVELIYNGFDPELFYPETTPTRHFIITYTGRLLSPALRDPSLFLEALSILIKEKVIYPPDCQVHWYVDEASWKIITGEAEKQNVLSYMNFKGYVSGAKIPHILNNSSILLLLTNKATGNGPKGTMTTKFFESLAVEKPILCVRSDESYLAEALEESHAGLAATHVEEVCEFLKHHYKAWKINGYTHSSVDKEVVQRYSRKEQAGQFATLFDRLTDKPENKAEPHA
ncbi:glycosyltransferase [Parabacteroides sp. PF5-6]|uniref:glycosyltransferase n=1 Tax=Parabacteroides sp. PF5-6 TaxID=1742403 RepID=UPI002405C643|nr:glycosyltransferase [Parabacteroides sp. PF5-6]MDF9831026.1 glycosyltransferase involved in cell wall biosynthesis [Parabacteroides sp. PF5-6]